MHPRGLTERFYTAAHWAHGPKWTIHSPEGEHWFRFDCIRVLDGLSPQILLVPLPGHSRGHCGVAVETPNGWLFDCGDAYAVFYDIDPDHPHRPPIPLWLKHRLTGLHVPRLLALACEHRDEVQLFCAHDPWEYRRYQGGETAESWQTRQT